jgi:hypothetical protein
MGRRTRAAGDEPFPLDWALVSRLVHPLKVLIIEALAWIGQPLAASDLSKVFERRFSTPFISYHVQELAKVKVLVKMGEENGRGAIKKLYFLPSAA